MRSALAGLSATVLVAALAGPAVANGRDPFTSTINFRPGNDQHIMAGMTFGLISSKDGGQTWRWYCEAAVGYGGTYDPDYAYTQSGKVFATTFDGMKVMADDCSFTATPPGMTFVSSIERSANGDIFYAASTMTDTKIYRSTDDGVTFPVSATPGLPNDWWQTIEVAPSDASRVYLTGYRLPMKCTSNSTSNAGQPCMVQTDCPGGACEPQKEFLLFRSTDRGVSYAPMSMTGITPISQNSAIEIVGIDPIDADIVYARVTLENATNGDSIYRSNDGGDSWTKILSRSSNIGGLSFLVRNDRSCVAGTRDLGAWRSPYVNNEGCGATWTDLTGAPHIGCLYENAAGEVWACTQNTASPQLGITSDGFGIMKSADLTTWTGVLRFQDLQAPVECPDGTVQRDRCVLRAPGEQSAWCCLVTQLGLTSQAVDCSGTMACFAPLPEPALDGGTTMVKPPDPGCCDANAQPPALLTLLVASVLLLRRRRTTSKER